MDELQVLKEFRADVASAGVDEPVRERTMAAIRALIEREAEAKPASAKRIGSRQRAFSVPRFSRRRLAALAICVAALLAIVAVLPARQSNESLIGEALAAIGSGSVLHVVAEQPTGRELIDLSTGQTTPILQQEEIWFDESRGLRRDITTINGRIADDTFQSPAGGFTPHGIIYDCTWIAAHPKQATKARVSCNASGDNGTTPHVVPRPKPTLDPGLLGFVDGYRGALTSGAAREGGSGAIDGRAVDWLIFQTSNGPERVALDKATHKPIRLDGPHIFEQMKITSIETTDDAQGKFVRPAANETPVLPSRGSSTDKQKLDLNASAISASYAGAVWAGMSVGGLPLASATVQLLTTSYPDDTPTASGEGLQLQYGSLTANGHRDFSKPYVTISEAPSPELASAYMWGFVGLAPPAPGQLLTEVPRPGVADALYIGFTSRNGRLVSIQASSEELLLAGARSLTEAK